MPAGGVREQATQYFGMGSKWLRSTTSKVGHPLAISAKHLSGGRRAAGVLD